MSVIILDTLPLFYILFPLEIYSHHIVMIYPQKDVASSLRSQSLQVTMIIFK